MTDRICTPIAAVVVGLVWWLDAHLPGSSVTSSATPNADT